MALNVNTKDSMQIPAAGDATVTVHSEVSDTVAVSDTLPAEESYAFVLERTDTSELNERNVQKSPDVSWLLSGLLILFMIIAIRYRKNSKYLSAIFKEVTSVRERGNILDNTVREVSFMLILNFLWVLSAGILLYSTLSRGGDNAMDMAECVVATFIYEIAMTIGYTVVGNVFSDGKHTRLWVRGFWAAQSLAAALLFPISIFLICYPGNSIWVIAIGWIWFGITKILFIWKGFRIFFAQISSWVLFLYYLCSLEIVPLILMVVFANFLMSGIKL